MKAKEIISRIQDSWLFFAVYLAVLAAGIGTYHHLFRPPEWHKYYPYSPSLPAWVLLLFLGLLVICAMFVALDWFVLERFRKRKLGDSFSWNVLMLFFAAAVGSVVHLGTWLIGAGIITHLDLRDQYSHTDPRLIWYCGLGLSAVCTFIWRSIPSDNW